MEELEYKVEKGFFDSGRNFLDSAKLINTICEKESDVEKAWGLTTTTIVLSSLSIELFLKSLNVKMIFYDSKNEKGITHKIYYNDGHNLFLLLNALPDEIRNKLISSYNDVVQRNLERDLEQHKDAFSVWRYPYPKSGDIKGMVCKSASVSVLLKICEFLFSELKTIILMPKDLRPS